MNMVAPRPLWHLRASPRVVVALGRVPRVTLPGTPWASRGSLVTATPVAWGHLGPWGSHAISGTAAGLRAAARLGSSAQERRLEDRLLQGRDRCSHSQRNGVHGQLIAICFSASTVL